MSSPRNGAGVIVGVLVFCLVGIIGLVADLPPGPALSRAAVAALVVGLLAEAALAIARAVVQQGLQQAQDSDTQNVE